MALFQVKFIFLAAGGWSLSSSASARCATKFLPQEPVQGIKELLLLSQFRPVEGGNGGRGRPLTPPFSTLLHNGAIERAPQSGAEKKRPKESIQSPRAQTRHSSPGKCQYLGTAISISADPPTCNSCWRLWRAALLPPVPIPSPVREPSPHYLG